MAKTVFDVSKPTLFSPTIAYLEEQHRIVRKVALPGGDSFLSAVPRAFRFDGDPHSLFDLNWLGLTTHPEKPGGPTLRSVDLFSGCGGFTVGIGEAARALERDHQAVGAVDFARSQAEIFATNHPEADVRCADINEVLPGGPGDGPVSFRDLGIEGWLEPDFVVGGPPCQGHSHLNNATRGSDPRNLLALKMARAAELLRPRFVIVENVPGVWRDVHRAWERTREALRGVAGGYQSVSLVLSAEDFGVAQTRRRSFMLAWSIAKCPRITADLVETILAGFRTQERPIEWALTAIRPSAGRGPVFDSPPRVTPTVQERIDYLFLHGLYNLPDELRPDCHRLKEHSYQSIYGRMHPGKPASTMTTGFSVMGRGRFVHPHEPRMLTPHEAARIQFFPDFFQFGDRGRTELTLAIGNAVPPKMGFVTALTLLLADLVSR